METRKTKREVEKVFLVYFFGGLEFVGPSFSDVVHFVFLGDVWIRTHRAAVSSRCSIYSSKPQISFEVENVAVLTVLDKGGGGDCGLSEGANAGELRVHEHSYLSVHCNENPTCIFLFWE
jgi:hypothetical protein